MIFKKLSYIFLIITFSILFSGCSRVIDWGKRTFNQGCKVEACIDLVRAHIRTVRIYDQLKTLGIFDVLWLSNEVRTVYADLHAEKFMLNEATLQDLKSQELAQNKEYLSFYILGYDPKFISDGPFTATGKKNNSNWTVVLKVNDKFYEPEVLNIVKLNPEYILFFGKKLSKFKTVYLVQFSKFDSNNNPIIDSNTRTFTLCFGSIKRKGAVSWNVINEKLIIPEQECTCLIQEDKTECKQCCRNKGK